MSDVSPELETAAAPARSRAGGRQGKRDTRAGPFDQPPFRQLKRPFEPVKYVSDDQLESIHLASLRVMKEIGLDVLHEGARAIMKKAGADVTPGVERVRFDSELILETIASAPSEFTLHARNPEHNVRFGGNNVIFAQMGYSAGVFDARLFSAVTLMVMATTFVAPPLLKLLFPSVGPPDANRQHEGISELV